jgi:serine/threonine-protein kinase
MLDATLRTDESIALGATVAAPLPAVTGGSLVPPASASRPSVLPRVEMERGTVQLVPNEGPRYQKVRKLGAGGMGEVALVEDRDIGRPVAVKRLLPSENSAGALARFVDEVRIVGRLEHPNIVPIHDVGVDEQGDYFFVMKYVEGETLEHVIERLRAHDTEYLEAYDMVRRTEIFMSLLRALAYAHSKGILHRDVKPANIMVGRFGEVVLMDWGVARPIGGNREGNAATTPLIETHGTRASSTHAGALIGSPLYMSPEQAAGKNDELDARSDLYAACVVFHELLGLKNRYEKITDLRQLITAVTTRDAPSAHAMFDSAGGIPAELMHFLRRGLRLRREDRWQSAEEMLAAMHDITGGRCRVQCAVTFLKRGSRETGRFIDRRPILAVVMAVMMLAVFVTAVIIAARGMMA